MNGPVNGNVNGNQSLTTQGLPMPGLSGQANGPVGMSTPPNPRLHVPLPLTRNGTGNLLKGAVAEDGKLKDAGLMVGIKLDLEAEVHLTARVRGDILVGLY